MRQCAQLPLWDLSLPGFLFGMQNECIFVKRSVEYVFWEYSPRQERAQHLYFVAGNTQRILLPASCFPWLWRRLFSGSSTYFDSIETIFYVSRSECYQKVNLSAPNVPSRGYLSLRIRCTTKSLQLPTNKTHFPHVRPQDHAGFGPYDAVGSTDRDLIVLPVKTDNLLSVRSQQRHWNISGYIRCLSRSGFKGLSIRQCFRSMRTSCVSSVTSFLELVNVYTGACGISVPGLFYFATGTSRDR